MERTIRLSSIFLLLLTIMLPAAVVLAADASIGEVSKSWDSAKVYLPGKFFTTTPAKVTVEKPLPVVIYLHGCTGYESGDLAWGEFIKDLGYIAVLPDSFARRNVPNCDPKTKGGSLFPKAHAMRQEEIANAYEQVRKSPWADQNNVFLMGHSEGGVAVARSKQAGFSGIIISGWRCTNKKYPSFDGIFAPHDTPVLTLEWSHDEWEHENTKGSCADKFGDRTSARQVLLSGRGHTTSDQKEARDAVDRFIKDNLKR